MNLLIKSPKTLDDFKRYYNLRWKVLRKPLNNARGSEKDKFDGISDHIMICYESKVIGVGRIKINSISEAQIDYIAVDKKFRKKGIGRIIIKELEDIVRGKVKKIILHSRENAIKFYEINGYNVLSKSYVSCGVVHFKMIKSLISSW